MFEFGKKVLPAFPEWIMLFADLCVIGTGFGADSMTLLLISLARLWYMALKWSMAQNTVITGMTYVVFEIFLD